MLAWDVKRCLARKESDSWVFSHGWVGCWGTRGRVVFVRPFPLEEIVPINNVKKERKKSNLARHLTETTLLYIGQMKQSALSLRSVHTYHQRTRVQQNHTHRINDEDIRRGKTESNGFFYSTCEQTFLPVVFSIHKCQRVYSQKSEGMTQNPNRHSSILFSF